MKTSLVLHVNGKERTINVDGETPLLYVLRNTFQLNGPKFGCGMQQCGACMVLLDGRAQPSCMLPVSSAVSHQITTLEGLSKNGKLHPMQQAMIDEQAAQCGYCVNAMVICAVGLLNENSSPDDDDIRLGMQRCLCRCGTQARVIKAIKKVSK